MTDPRLDWFRALDLELNVPFADVTAARRDLLQVWHPDRFPDNPRLRARATRKTMEINAAYDQLTHYYRSRDQTTLAAVPTPQGSDNRAQQAPSRPRTTDRDQQAGRAGGAGHSPPPRRAPSKRSPGVGGVILVLVIFATCLYGGLRQYRQLRKELESTQAQLQAAQLAQASMRQELARNEAVAQDAAQQGAFALFQTEQVSRATIALIIWEAALRERGAQVAANQQYLTQVAQALDAQAARASELQRQAVETYTAAARASGQRYRGDLTSGSEVAALQA
jgi:hypothetical protein